MEYPAVFFRSIIFSNSMYALFLLPFLTASYAAPAATLVVNSTADDSVAGNGLVTLREAINAAINDTTTDLGQTGTANDTILLSDLQGQIKLTSAMAVINQSITIIGPGADRLSVNGDGVHNFLTLNSGANVMLHDLTVENCFRTTNGGAVSTLGAFTATNCVFTGNRTSFSGLLFNCMGSAIYGGSAASSIQLNGCTVSHNASELVMPGGSQFFIGSAVGTLGGSISADQCTFDGNSTVISGTPTSGGGMGNTLGVISGGTVSLTNSTIKNGFFKNPLSSNFTSWGTVYIGAAGCRFTAEGCTWTGNTGYPAVCIYTISNTTTANNIQLLNCTFSQNGNHESGSMLLCFNNSAAKLTVEHCTFADNETRAGIPATLDATVSSVTPQVQFANSVLASANKELNRPEIRGGFPFTSNGFNFISNNGGAIPTQPDMSYNSTTVTEVSQLVNALDNNGGFTATCSLPDGSVLIDAANPTGFAATDQRDVIRPRNGDQAGGAAPDIGAYERFNGDLKVAKTVDRSQAANGATITYTLAVTNEHPTEEASGIELTDILPENLQYLGTGSNTFNSYTIQDGTLTARRSTLTAGASASITLTFKVLPHVITNTAVAVQKGYELAPANNTAAATTTLITPPVPRVTAFGALSTAVTSATSIMFRLNFDGAVSGVDLTDFIIIPPSSTVAVQSVNALNPGTYNVTVSGISEDGPTALLLVDDDTIRSVSGDEPLGGFAIDGSTTSTFVTIDQTPPVSAPVAAAVSPGETTTTKFFLLYSATDANGVAGTSIFLRRGNSGPFQLLAGGPFTTGYAEVDTALYGGYGTYELYTRATDLAGNQETKLPAPEITVTLSPGTPTAALHWELYH